MITKGGVFIELFHGRRDPCQDMENWGEPGPIFGPFQFVHATYASDLKLGNTPQNLSAMRGMVYYDGMWYGDWSVFPSSIFEAETNLQERRQDFDMTKTAIPEDIKRRLIHEQ